MEWQCSALIPFHLQCISIAVCRVKLLCVSPRSAGLSPLTTSALAGAHRRQAEALGNGTFPAIQSLLLRACDRLHVMHVVHAACPLLPLSQQQ